MVADEAQDENAELRVAIAALERSAAEEGAWTSTRAKAERVLLANRARVLADALAVAAVSEADLAGVAQGEAHHNLASYVAAKSSIAPAEIRSDSKLAYWLRSVPGLEAAFSAGRVTRRHLEKLEETDNPRIHGEFRAQISMLIEHAETLPWTEFLTALRYWVTANDLDGAEPKDQIRRSGVTVKRHRDGTVTGKFRLDPLAGAAFVRAFEAELEKLRNQDIKTGDTRSRYQRGAAALLGLVGRGFARPDGTFPTPLVNIVASQQVAEQILSKISGEDAETETWPLDHADVDGRCELIDGTPIHPHFVMAAMAVGRFQRHVFDTKTQRIIETSQQRFFPKTMRHIFNLESRGRCTDRGCDAPFSWLQADHIVPSSRGGPTSRPNGHNKCGPSNRFKSDSMPAAL